MAAKTEVLLDTSALIAFLDTSDTHHSIFKRLFADPPRMVASSLVVAEAHAWFLRRYDRRRAERFLDFIDVLPKPTFVPFDSLALSQAELCIRKFNDQNLTLADAHGLALASARKIKLCWSTDRHLTLTGARLVI